MCCKVIGSDCRKKRGIGARGGVYSCIGLRRVGGGEQAATSRFRKDDLHSTVRGAETVAVFSFARKTQFYRLPQPFHRDDTRCLLLLIRRVLSGTSGGLGRRCAYIIQGKNRCCPTSELPFRNDVAVVTVVHVGFRAQLLQRQPSLLPRRSKAQSGFNQPRRGQPEPRLRKQSVPGNAFPGAQPRHGEELHMLSRSKHLKVNFGFG
mmetsp:Transcript_66906/g.131228  ORF Transcript_66906/g.131228 Transcript_66906/m.131228 type:complete len:206 (-) Transcript_66906:79-696(-)